MRYAEALGELRGRSRTWLVTGVAGFIGSHLAETLLREGQRVVGLDNFATGSQRNLDDIRNGLAPDQWARFSFIQGDIRKLDDCHQACVGIDIVLHQAALGSVPRSVQDPIATNETNASGFLNMLVAARDAEVGRFVYAASSSTYGDYEGLPKTEDRIGRPLSPYAVTKYLNELYADVFHRTYGLSVVGLRYFNVFGPRQDPNGAYAAVIPTWFGNLLRDEPVHINGDGETTRDFTYIDNVVQANVLAATTTDHSALNQVYNVAFGERVSLNELFELIRQRVGSFRPYALAAVPVYGEFRAGDVRHSLADISKARTLLSYAPANSARDGLDRASAWYRNNLLSTGSSL